MDEAFFKQRYEADAANKARQSWKDYHAWVETFYEGKRFPPVPGWADREREILGKLPQARRGEVHEALEGTARLLASEWAKDNSVRKVSTGDLQAWGRRFSDAAEDPDVLLQALHDVEADLHGRMK